jgi:hypothetical protein
MWLVGLAGLVGHGVPLEQLVGLPLTGLVPLVARQGKPCLGTQT